MRTNKTLDEVLAKVTPALKAKIEYSVNLLRKAEKLALTYDPEDGFFLAFSAGKDSQALYHIAELAGVKFKGHMNLTSVDPPEVIRFAHQYYPEVELKKPSDSIFNEAVKRGILPTMRVRWCCATYKETAGAGKVTLIGIRHAESVRRSKRNEVEISDRKYSGTLEGLDEYRRNKPKRGRKPKNPKPFNINTAEGESQAGCISGKESLLISPIIHWEEKDVWDFLKAMEVPHCSLYDEGWKRLGCINCPMASPKQKAIENKRWPHVKRNWIKAIIAIRQGGGITRRTYNPQDQPRTMEYVIRGGQDQSSASRNNGWATKEIGKGSQAICKNTEEKGNNLPPQKTTIPDEEWQTAEAIYDWWISGKSYKKWYSERFQQGKLNFNDNEND